jgi:flagellar hook protein FlgE
MSLYGAMMTGVAGLSANSTALSVASSNIANVNTVGYKTATSEFSTLLASAAGTSDPSSAGVTATAGQNVTQQGLLTTTSSSTDLAISGNGFFVVSSSPTDTSTQEYTRAGSFTTDSSGNLKNASGLYLMGWALDSDGNTPTNPNDLSLINVSNLSGKAVASTKITLQANLQASATDGFQLHHRRYDVRHGDARLPAHDQRRRQPGRHAASGILLRQDGANTWAYEVSYQGDSSDITGSNPIATAR